MPKNSAFLKRMQFRCEGKVSPIIVIADGLCHSQHLTRPAAAADRQPRLQASHTFPGRLPRAKTVRIRDQVDGVRAAQKLSGKSRKVRDREPSKTDQVFVRPNNRLFCLAREALNFGTRSIRWRINGAALICTLIFLFLFIPKLLFS